MSSSAELAQARALLSEGKLDAAEQHRLGQVLHDGGDIDGAVRRYVTALRLDPALVEARRDLGAAYAAKGLDREALACLEEVLGRSPTDDVAHVLKADLLRRGGNFRPALHHFLRAFSLRIEKRLAALWPRRTPADRAPLGDNALAEKVSQARTLRERGAWTELVALIEEIMRGAPDHAEAHYLLGSAEAAKGRLQEAAALVEQAVKLDPLAIEYRVTLGELLVRLESFEAAIEVLAGAVHDEPAHLAAHARLAFALHRIERSAEAEAHAMIAVRGDPASRMAQDVATLVSAGLGRFEQAEGHAREALRLDPSAANGHRNLGSVLKERGQIDEARRAFEEALRLAPNDPEVCVAMGAFEMDLGRVAESIPWGRRGLALDPDSASSHLLLANAHLLLGDYEEGWREYEWRRKSRQQRATHRSFDRLAEKHAKWVGQDLRSKTILIYPEQALGEQILFTTRFVPSIAARALRCIVFCDERLVALFERSIPGVEFVAAVRQREVLPFDVPQAVDYVAAMGSLPSLLGGAMLRPESTESSFALLKADSAKTAAWRSRLRSAAGAPTVGLTWRGGVMLTGRIKRSPGLATLLPLLRSYEATWVSLQHGDCEAEIRRIAEDCGVVVRHYPEAIGDIDELAALSAALDCRVTVCNTVAHLCGALGLPSTVLAPPVTIWPYGLGDRMPWYPTARVLRQVQYGDWSGPVAAALEQFAEAGFARRIEGVS